MDDNGQRETGRHKTDPYNKSLHTQWMMPQHQMKDTHTLKLMAIMAERDKAIQERNIALSEKRAALAERDMAFLQRNAAFNERETAIMERDNAIATLEYARENGFSAINGTSCSPGCTAPHLSNNNYQQHQHQQHHHQHQHQHQQHHHQQQQHLQHVHAQQPELSDSPYHHSGEMHISEAYPISANSEDVVKAPKPKRKKKETKVKTTLSKKPAKLPRKNKKGRGEDMNMLKAPKQQIEWRDDDGVEEDSHEQIGTNKHSEWKGQDLGLNLVTFDDATMPVPVCSCTGKYQQCYKWGNGGWQSACCTTTMSMYPLPVMENKRHARVGGRKMSGGVFNKLLSQKVAEGHDMSMPLDLKDHWAKHGTNRYITIK